MKQSIILVTALIATALGSDVVDLKEGNFDSFLKDKELVLVEFFAPWCGHCKRLAPEYEKAATALKKNDPPIVLAKVDATEESSLASKYGIRGYPTLKIWRNGALSSDYDGPRDADGIIKYMKKQAGPSSKELASENDFNAFLSKDEFSVVGFFSSDESAMSKTFQRVADSKRNDYRFAHTTNSALVEEYGSGKVVVFQPSAIHNKMEPSFTTYDGKAADKELTSFIEDGIKGTVGVMTQENQQLFLSSKPLLVVYYDLNLKLDPSRAKYIRNRVLKTAKSTESALTFAVANKDDFSNHITEFGLTKDVSVAIHGEGNTKYRLTEEFGLDTLKAFIEDFNTDKLESYIKSEPVPDNSENDVKVVVGKNFDDIVVKDKDVFIEFYAPWCGHCKKLAPTWDELGEKFAKEDSVVIAKMDATANDYPSSFPVRGYPSIFWVPAGSTTPKKYDGGRELDDLVKHVKDNASNLSKATRDEL